MNRRALGRLAGGAVLTIAALGAVRTIGRLVATPILASYTYSRQVVDRDGRLLRLTLSGDEKYRIYTPLARIHPTLVEAVLLHEDRHFREHPGINPVALIRAAVRTYGGGGRRMGGSTITMQLARITSTTPSKTLLGKAVQISRALVLDFFHSKDEILEAYLNLLPYGANVEGVGAASLVYFSKSARELLLPESLTLAVVPQNPNARRVGADGSLRDARAKLLTAWLEHAPNDAGADLDFRIGLESRSIKSLPFLAPHFTDLALARSAGPDFRKNGLVRTTLDRSVQEMLEGKVNSYVKSRASIGIHNAAAIVLDHEKMEVVGLVGSADFFDADIQGQVNGALAKRSPGSTLKPFAYALALDQGLIHPLSLLKDTPMSFSGFDPENYDRAFAGPLSATDALVKSRNVPAVYLASLLKSPTLYNFMKDGGITQLREPVFYGLSLPLGGAEVTMEELVRLYAMLANRGELREVHYLGPALHAEIGAVPETALETARGRRLLSPESSFLALDMLRSNPRGNARGMEDWLRDSVPVAWKTGTSHGFRDAWSVGVVGPYVIAVWLGNFDGEGNPAINGRDLAAPLFFGIVDALKSRARNDHLWLSTVGLNVKKVSVCAISGQLPGRHCHHQTETWFIPGRSPIAPCTIHRELLVSKRTGRRACDDAVASADLARDVFEFWPSDLLRIFSVAGIPRKSPPAYDPSCGVDRTQNSGLAPSITSPRREVVYSLRVAPGPRPAEERIPFEAVADGDARQLHWFLGQEYLGKTDPFRSLLWTPKPGKYVVRVVDDLGRSDAREIVVKVTR